MDKKDFKMIPKAKILKIGSREVDISRIAADRVMKATDLYNEMIVEKERAYSESMGLILSVVLMLIRIDFSVQNILDWAKRRIITKRYILKHTDYSELNDFVELALEPILGDKKKERRHMEMLKEVERKLLERVPPEQLAKLLENSLLSLDGLGAKSSSSPLTK